MKKDLREIMSAFRPPCSQWRDYKDLVEIARKLQRLLLKNRANSTLALDQNNFAELVAAIVEFAEDMHAEVGLWTTLEKMQCEFFDTPLPFLVDPTDTDPELSTFDQRRVQFLIWTLLPLMVDDLVLSPTHPELQKIAELVSQYLVDAFASMPKKSGVKTFLSSDNRHGWDIKRKLVWLGLFPLAIS